MNDIRERITKFTIIILAIGVYTTLFFLQPLSSFVGDFITDYDIVSLYSNSTPLASTFTFTPYYYGNFAYNLIVYLNYTYFEMGTLFPKIVSFSLTVIIVILFVLLTYKKDQKIRPLRYLGMLVALFVGINWFGIFETSSLIFIKFYILNLLLTYALLYLAFKNNHLVLKIVLWILAIGIQILTFNLCFPIIVIILAIKENKLQKSIISVPFVLISLLFFAGLTYIYQNQGFFENFSFPTLEDGHDRVVNTLSSLIVPLNRVDYSDTTRWLYMFAACFGAFYLIAFPIVAIKHKYRSFALVSYFTLLGIVILQILNYKEYGYYYSQCYEINSLFVGVGIYYLLEDISLHNFKKPAFKANMYFDLKSIISTATLSAVFVAILLSSQTLYKSYQNNSDPYNDLEFASSYDMGEIDDDLRGIFDDEKEHLNNAYSYYKEKGYIQAEQQSLESNQSYISLSSVNVIRGIKKDNKGQYWMADNFSFEIYVNNYFLDLSLYTPAGDNKVTIYANNNLLGTFDLKGNTNNLVELRVGEYYQQDVIIRGNFESTFKGAFDKDGLWAVEFIGLSYNNTYGLNSKQSDGLVWTKKDFGFYVPEISNSLQLSLYEPSSSSSNSIIGYFNGEIIYQSSIKSGFHNYLIDVEIFKGQSGYFDFVLDHVSESTSDSRILGVVYQGYSFVKISYEFSKTIDISSGFLTINMNHDTFASAGDISIQINGENSIIYSASYGYKYILRTAKYIGQSIELKIGFSKPLNDQNDNVSKNLSFSQSNTLGFNYAESDGTIWSTNDFEICLENKQKGIKISYYELSDLLPNPYKVYINDTLVKEGSITEQLSSIVIDSKDFDDSYIYVHVVLENKYINPNDKRVLGFIYHGYQYVDLSYSASKTCQIENGFTYVSFPTSVIGTNNLASFKINDLPLSDFKYEKLSNDKYLFYTKDYIGQSLTFTFDFVDPVISDRNSINNKISISQTNSLGLNSAESNGTIWTTNKFTFCIENKQSVAAFKFYEISTLAPNPCKIYLNDILYNETFIKADSSSIDVDTSIVDDEYVYVTFELANTKSDGRTLGVIYNGFEYKEGVLHTSKNITISAGYTTVEIQNSLFVKNNNITFKIGDNVVPIYSTNGNKFILRTSDYIGQQVKLIIRFTRCMSAYALPTLLVSCSDNVGLNEPESNGTIWATKKFGYYIDNRENSISSVKFTFYEVESLNENPIKVYINTLLVYEGTLKTNFNYIEIALDNSSYSYIEFEIENANNDGREIAAIVSNVEYINKEGL